MASEPKIGDVVVVDWPNNIPMFGVCLEFAPKPFNPSDFIMRCETCGHTDFDHYLLEHKCLFEDCDCMHFERQYYPGQEIKP